MVRSQEGRIFIGVVKVDFSGLGGVGEMGDHYHGISCIFGAKDVQETGRCSNQAFKNIVFTS